jgi:hypothetical protein
LNCKACNRETIGRDFCPLHLKAYENIVKKYDFWRKALKISWKEYLSQIDNNPLTGECAKETAEYLIGNEEVKNVKKS